MSELLLQDRQEAEEEEAHVVGKRLDGQAAEASKQVDLAMREREREGRKGRAGTGGWERER